MRTSIAGVLGLLPLAGAVRILQISDIHVSHYHTKSADNLKAFCDAEYKRLAGEVDIVVLSGDLTDASPPFYTFTQRGQQAEDWKLLSESFRSCLKFDKPIFSVRGNHDGFGVADYDSDSNALYREFHASLARRRSEIASTVILRGERNGSQLLQFPAGADGKKVELVILLDSVYNTGVARHFYGYFPETLEDWLESEISNVSDPLSTVTVVSHYPIGTYRRPDRLRMLEFLARHGVKSFHAGHLHTILGRPMLAHWKDERTGLDVQEHEVADFKAKQIVRIIETETGNVFDFHRTTAESVSDFGANKQSILLPTASTSTSHSGKTLQTDAEEEEFKIFTTTYRELGIFGRTLFKNFQETIDSVALLAHAAGVLMSLFVYLRQANEKSNFFAKTNLVVVGLLPILPFCFTQVFPGSVGLNFWWGGISHRGISSNDTVASDVVMLDTKIFLAMAVLALYTKFRNLGVRVVGGLCIVLATGPSIYLNMYRGGLLGLLSLTFAWDVFFWVYSPLGFNRLAHHDRTK